MRNSHYAIAITLALSSLPGCAPSSTAAAKPASGAVAEADKAAPDHAAAPPRVAILPPEASRITYALLGKQPPLGARLPKSVQYSPDGKLITYLARQPDGPEQALFAFDLSSRSIRQLLSSADLMKTSAPLSREEELRRERQRMFSKGLTAYGWAKRAPVMLVPFGGDLFLRDKDGAITRLTETQGPEIDPQLCAGGERVVFVRGSELFALDIASRRETALTKGAPEGVTRGLSDFNGQEEFGEMSGFWISPACDKVAYLEVDEREVGKVPVLGFRGGQEDLMMQRYPRAGTKNPKVRVGIVDIATGAKKTTWLAWPKDEERYVGRFSWAPDGSALFLQSLTRDQKRLGLMRVDPRSGQAKEIVSETSPAWIEYAEMRLVERSWASGAAPRLLWTSGASGHVHLTLRDASTGAEIAKLTSGDWDVIDIPGIDEERGEVHLVATKEAPTERHLYALPLAGGELRRLTAEPGLHNVSVDPRGQSFVDVHAALDRPWKAAVRGRDGGEIGAIPVSFDLELADLGLRAPELVKVRAASGDTLVGSLLRPRTVEPGRRYPVVVMVYGGPGVQTVLNSWSPRLLWNHLADRGVVVFQLDNRGSSGRGPAFEHAIYGRLGEIELADQLAGIETLKTLPFVDASRIGIYGHSYGGMMTLHALLKAPDVFRVGVAASPSVDHRLYDTGYTERYMGLVEKNAAAYDGADISKAAGNLRGKLLLLHGLMDENVHFLHSAKLIEALMAADKRFDMMVLPSERHGYKSPVASTYTARTIVEYLVEHL